MFAAQNAVRALKFLLYKRIIMTEIELSARRVKAAGIVLGIACVAYFYVLDRIGFSSVSFSPIFRMLLKRDSATAWVALAICGLAATWTRSEPITKLVAFLGAHINSVAVASLGLIALGTLTIYHNYPISMDEYAAVFQSKIFAAGQMSAHMPPKYIDWIFVRGFNGEFLTASRVTGEAVEVYWPGFALLLAPFQFLGIPWLCNAALAGLALFLIHRITVDITRDQLAAGWAVLFTVASGAFVVDALSYYSLQSHMTANLLFVTLLLRPSVKRAAAAGLIGSFALILHNPVPHALFAMPWIFALTLQKTQRRYLLPLLLGYLPGIATGVIWMIYRTDIGGGIQNISTLNGIGSGVFVWPNLAVFNARVAAAVKMWIWAVPCLFVLAFLGAVRFRKDPHARLMAISATLTFVGYLFVSFDQGHGWGYRYFHSAWGVVPILAGCAISDRLKTNTRLVAFCGAVAVLSLVVLVPIQLFQVDRFVSGQLAQLSAPIRPGNNVYFIHPAGGFYIADMVQSDPLLRNSDLFLASRGSELDARMVAENWPRAIKIHGDMGYDQWYLGPADQRQVPPNQREQRFLLTGDPLR
jgi:hypothetical protein